MFIATLFLLTVSGTSPLTPAEDVRSSPDHVDPWDVVTDYDFSNSRTAMESHIHIVDKTLRLAQKDIKYFEEVTEPWQRPDPGEDHIMGFNFTAWNRTYIRPPKGFGDKQALEMMNKMTVPEFDITKIKLKPANKNNNSMIFSVVMKLGPENKIIGYSSKRLHVQIQVPSYPGAADNELARYLSKVLCVPRKLIKVKQGAGQNIRKVRIPKMAVQERVFLRKLIKEFELEKVTEKKFDA